MSNLLLSLSLTVKRIAPSLRVISPTMSSKLRSIAPSTNLCEPSGNSRLQQLVEPIETTVPAHGVPVAPLRVWKTLVREHKLGRIPVSEKIQSQQGLSKVRIAFPLPGQNQPIWRLNLQISSRKEHMIPFWCGDLESIASADPYIQLKELRRMLLRHST